MWDVTVNRSTSRLLSKFLLTHPVWDVTSSSAMFPICSRISTHTSRVGCDWIFDTHTDATAFLLTHPVWDVTKVRTIKNMHILFLLTHPVWDVTIVSTLATPALKFLLTHPVWDVTSRSVLPNGAKNFYSHIPCGMWPPRSCILTPVVTFLLTHPVWDVTQENWNKC